MWSVPLPKSAVRTVYPDCLDDVADANAKAKYASASLDVFTKSDTFVKALSTSDVHSLEPAKFEVTALATAELIALYEQHLVGAKLPAARAHYDRIRALSEWCYACGHEIAEEVDHYLPKKKFPALVVTPENLTPICIRCNRAKRVGFGRTRAETFIHPYIDNFESVVWLHADLHTQPEPHLTFRAYVSTWDTTTLDRASNHMRRFKLSYFFGIQANRAARQARKSLDLHFDIGGTEQVKAEAKLRASSAREDRLNSWEAAAWSAFADSEWFCEGGFRQFGRKVEALPL